MIAALALSVALHATSLQPRSLDDDTLRGPVDPTRWAVEIQPTPPLLPPVLLAQGDTTVRPRAVQHSDAYYLRLDWHRKLSYAIYPLFAIEYPLGNKLMAYGQPASWVKPAHGVVAGAISAVFVANTITGVWNLWDDRKDPDDRTRRWVHSVSMLAADAGFVAVGITAQRAHSDDSARSLHRDLAIGSMGLSTVSSLMMLLWPH
jgi:hypothetical protein